MNPCDRYSIAMMHYLDSELSGRELADFRDHLLECANCRSNLAGEQALSALLKRSRPLYSAPEALSARVSALVSGSSSAGRPWSRLYFYIQRLLLPVPGWKALTASAVLGILCVLFIAVLIRQARAANYVETAVAAHRGYLDGSRPLEIRSDSSEAVMAWLATKVPFGFRLPAGQSAVSEGVYHLQGARSVNYEQTPAALVTYEAESEKVSLLVASSKAAVVAGGGQVHSGRLTFHYYRVANFRVITWDSHGLSYALVSSLSESAQESCLVCHQNMADHNAFKRTE
jgi:anti-sigma factor RsiW